MSTVTIMFPTTPPTTAPATLPESTAPAAPSLAQPTQGATHPFGGLFGGPANPSPTGLGPATSGPSLSPLSASAPSTASAPLISGHNPPTGPATEPAPYTVAFWCSILLGVVILGFWAIMVMRRRLREPDDAGQSDPGFSLSELRAMRDRGEITPEEYERTRAHVIAKVKASFDKPKKKKNGPSEDFAVTEGED